ncbi:MAG TPA: serine/threonine protein kinase, partial [Candidatus Competibacteraceae bacterium]|nr:serine/threonine protein kinase [Candidatus Competibacteraceae bacterium]
MNQLLKIGMTVQTEDGARSCRVEQFLGGGGQGEVYRATLDGAPVALKWYFPAQATAQQQRNLQLLIAKGAPTARFLWPLALAVSPEANGFGYLMPLREPRYHSIVDLMKRRVEPSFRVLATAGLELVHSFLELHARGLCYQDISFGNVCFDPTSGEVLIGDNDNVGVDGETGGGVLGTPRFIAPEVVRGEAAPSTQTDLFSLAVLLFYMFMIHHPLEGSKEAAIRCFDLPAMTRLYGTEPVFIFDPVDESNRPLPGYHDNALVFWPIYPEFFRALFTRAFTEGIHDPLHGRVRESEWRAALAQLRDLIVYCARCGAENFYDPAAGQSAVQTPGVCWSCRQPLRWPPRLHIGRQVIMLNHDSRLFPHHLEQQFYDFSTAQATVVQHPGNSAIWGLKNLTDRNWVITLNGGTIKEVEPGRSVTLAAGTR